MDTSMAGSFAIAGMYILSIKSNPNVASHVNALHDDGHRSKLGCTWQRDMNSP
jgi:hypothetical protein